MTSEHKRFVMAVYDWAITRLFAYLTDEFDPHDHLKTHNAYDDGYPESQNYEGWSLEPQVLVDDGIDHLDGLIVEEAYPRLYNEPCFADNGMEWETEYDKLQPGLAKFLEAVADDCNDQLSGQTRRIDNKVYHGNDPDAPPGPELGMPSETKLRELLEASPLGKEHGLPSSFEEPDDPAHER